MFPFLVGPNLVLISADVNGKAFTGTKDEANDDVHLALRRNRQL